MKNLFDVSGQVIAITGGGGILCGTMARALAEAGAKVAILDLSEASATKVADQIKAQGGADNGAGPLFGAPVLCHAKAGPWSPRRP